MSRASSTAALLRIAFVNPIPREIADRDRRNAGRVGRGERERRNVADDDPRAALAQERRFRRGEATAARA